MSGPGRAKVVEAMAAIDHTGQWIIYGFEGLDTIEALHETSVTEYLQDPIAYCKVRVMLYLPTEPKLPTVAGASMALDK